MKMCNFLQVLSKGGEVNILKHEIPREISTNNVPFFTERNLKIIIVFPCGLETYCLAKTTRTLVGVQKNRNGPSV